MEGSREAPARRHPPPAAAADPLRHLPELDFITNTRKEAALPREPSCASLSDVLALIEPRLGPAVLDAAARGALHAIAKRIPAMLSHFWGLEIRLGDPAPRADFLWEIRQGSADFLTPADGAPPMPGADIAGSLRERSPFWRELAVFAEEWLDSPDWLGRLGNIWLEADTASAADAELDACLDRPNLFWGANGRRATGTDRDLLDHLPALGRRFFGLEPDRDRIAAIADTIPEEAFAFQIGIMGARTIPVVRLCVKNLDTDMQLRWLGEIGWPGDRASLRNTLSRLEPLSGETALNVDFLPDRVGEKLGIEIYSKERMLSLDTWQPVHDELLAQGLARADKLEALRDFPWFQRYRQLGAWARTPPVGCPGVTTNLHHLKLVFTGDAAVEAKAYLGVFRPVMDYSPTRGGDVPGGGGWL